MKKSPLPKFELFLILFSLVGAIYFYYVFFIDSKAIDWIPLGSPRGTALTLSIIAWFISGPTFVINLFRGVFWFWYIRLAVILVCSVSYLVASSRM